MEDVRERIEGMYDENGSSIVVVIIMTIMTPGYHIAFFNRRSWVCSARIIMPYVISLIVPVVTTVTMSYFIIFE